MEMRASRQLQQGPDLSGICLRGGVASAHLQAAQKCLEFLRGVVVLPVGTNWQDCAATIVRCRHALEHRNSSTDSCDTRLLELH
jgi:hypothetical protein